MVTKVEVLIEPTGQTEIREYPDCSASYDPEDGELTIVDSDNGVIEVLLEPLIVKVVMEFK